MIASPRDPRWPETRAGILDAARGGTVLWDFDGVIADSEPTHAESYRVLLTRAGQDPEPDFFRPMVGSSEPKIWGVLKEQGYVVADDIATLAARRMEVFLELARNVLRPSWLVVDLSEALDGVARQVVVSNGNPLGVRTLLQAWNLAGVLEFVDQRRSGSADKETLLREFWRGGRTVTIDDHPRYLDQALAAGSFCVAVHHGFSSPSGSIHHVDIRI